MFPAWLKYLSSKLGNKVCRKHFHSCLIDRFVKVSSRLKKSHGKFRDAPKILSLSKSLQK